MVREFFVNLGFAEFTYARWDWMTTHSNLDHMAIGKIGLWEDTGRVIGIATYDTRPGTAYCLVFPEYAYLKKEMLLYAQEHLSCETKFGVMISDNDAEFQDIAAKLGFVATENKEHDAVFYLDKSTTDYSLPEGFWITSMQDTYDLYQYLRVLWKGFNHEVNGEGGFTYSIEKEEEASKGMQRPHVDLKLKIAVVAPDGNFVSYCGMWYEPRAGFAVIEPVATDPDYRKRGLGKAAVMEGIKRVGDLGAKVVFVGSSQQFYYQLGLRPFASATEWIKSSKR